ncbi:3-ketoacyl-ACP reductase [Lysinibacillus sphaericus]|uniref:SDR family NAD(P)-dependent oxidoreductase n=1 Tax=Lysinibacillus sphaericus TaxID=1421 RepID=UPI0018CF7D45|nr:glucose 1-dehydrogenase [Lysinibacillus sphaericus]MBG9453079.1 3-ketoacyl-ACP reductase [Lysinibacillus sphaericus]MBG9477628.1 3-ketoacyl-ACP reductase [Lysinibacillus sphaericus]MBG9594345.1 3-ketoacyl-ACP reductase [Lysinibacillus sphaericus]
MAVVQKVIIVTGAGGGMGKAIIQEQLAKGNIAVGLDLSVASLNDLAHDALRCFEVNVLQEERVNEVFKQIFNEYGRIDGLVNALGIAQAAKPIEQVTIDEWNRLMDVNVKSLFITTKAVVPYMKERLKGSIVTIASISAVRPRPGLQSYIASKGAAESFTRGLAIELAPFQIRVNTIHPGPADTQMLSQFTAQGADVEQTKQSVFVQSVPLGRLVNPSDIAGAVSYLLSDAASMVTGTTMHVDGGRGL